MNIILRTFAVLLFSSFVLYSNAKERHAEISKDKPRIVVLTDIAPGHIEPDDMESLVRYGADFFVERVKAHNPFAAPNIKPFHRFRPIPQSHIDNLIPADPNPQNYGY